jgi:hypothetical protein
MDQRRYSQCVPVNKDSSIKEEPFIDFTSGYVMRAIEHFPKQGSKEPWRLRQNYPRDILTLRYGELEDGTMRFSRDGIDADGVSTTAAAGSVAV